MLWFSSTGEFSARVSGILTCQVYTPIRYTHLSSWFMIHINEDIQVNMNIKELAQPSLALKIQYNYFFFNVELKKVLV